MVPGGDAAVVAGMSAAGGGWSRGSNLLRYFTGVDSRRGGEPVLLAASIRYVIGLFPRLAGLVRESGVYLSLGLLPVAGGVGVGFPAA